MAQYSGLYLTVGGNKLWSNSKSINLVPNVGFQIGLMKAMEINKLFKLKSGVMLVHNRASAPEVVHVSGKGHSGTVYVENDFVINSVQIPLYLEFNIIKKMGVFIGGNLGYAFYSKARYLSGTYYSPVDYDKQIELNRFIKGLNIGLNYDLGDVSIELIKQFHQNNISNDIELVFHNNKFGTTQLSINYFF